MISKINTAAIRGIEGVSVSIEVDIANGIPNFLIVGMVDTTVREARDRVKAAIGNSQCKYPNSRVVVSLMPANLKKKGAHFDLPIAMGILAASKQVLTSQLDESGFIGQLSLDGEIGKVNGVLSMAIEMKKSGIRRIFLPKENAYEAALVDNLDVIAVSHINEVIDYLNLKAKILPTTRSIRGESKYKRYPKDFSDVKGQDYVKRAVVIAIGGGHGMLLRGSPSSGKTMISERIPSILPSMSNEEILESTIIHSVAGNLSNEMEIINERPFRQPHSSITKAGLLGGGIVPMPGEITLAHNGVLFLDELGEYEKQILDSLRIPIESKSITLTRNGEIYKFPASFTFVAATNPCKCGYYGDSRIPCRCSAAELESYRNKLSGPIMDRIDMHVDVTPVNYKEITQGSGKSSMEMAKEVEKIRIISADRLKHEGISLNGQMEPCHIDKYCKIDGEGEKLVKAAYDRHMLNPRTYYRIIKVARTIADLNNSKDIKSSHIGEALQFRGDINDRNN
ncbi:magnesium chelatase family protein [Peptostreptococcaceae bacterium pGA-8]|nr:magnesium chelatase family protein [Peptostreptococcaceae bacterium pGA-8]